MALDTRWKNPQGKDPEQLWRWAQEITAELRKGAFFSTQIGDGITNAQLAEMAAWTFKMRNAGTTGEAQDQTINDLTAETAPDRAADFVPIWDAGGGDMNKLLLRHVAGTAIIAQGALSSQAVLDIPIPSWVDLLEVDIMSVLPVTDGAVPWIRFGQSGSFLSGASDYSWGYQRGGLAAQDTADSEIEMTVGIDNAISSMFKIWLGRPLASSFVKQCHFTGVFWSNGDANQQGTQGGGRLAANNDALDAFRFMFSTGNIASGYYAGRGYSFT